MQVYALYARMHLCKSLPVLEKNLIGHAFICDRQVASLYSWELKNILSSWDMLEAFIICKFGTHSLSHVRLFVTP